MKTLILNILEGSVKAEKSLYLKTTDHLMTVALRYVVDRSAARDVLQESYIRIFKQLAYFKYENDAATMAWMRRITSREAIRWIKKQQRWNEIDIQTYTDQVAATEPMFEDEMYRCLLVLPTNQRLVFNMYAIEGYSHKEIAQKLEIAESSSRSLLTRARKMLIQQINKAKAYEKLN